MGDTQCQEQRRIDPCRFRRECTPAGGDPPDPDWPLPPLTYKNAVTPDRVHVERRPVWLLRPGYSPAGAMAAACETTRTRSGFSTNNASRAATKSNTIATVKIGTQLPVRAAR